MEPTSCEVFDRSQSRPRSGRSCMPCRTPGTPAAALKWTHTNALLFLRTLGSRRQQRRPGTSFSLKTDGIVRSCHKTHGSEAKTGVSFVVCTTRHNYVRVIRTPQGSEGILLNSDICRCEAAEPAVKRKTSQEARLCHKTVHSCCRAAPVVASFMSARLSRDYRGSVKCRG